MVNDTGAMRRRAIVAKMRRSHRPQLPWLNVAPLGFPVVPLV